MFPPYQLFIRILDSHKLSLYRGEGSKVTKVKITNVIKQVPGKQEINQM